MEPENFGVENLGAWKFWSLKILEPGNSGAWDHLEDFSPRTDLDDFDTFP